MTTAEMTRSGTSAQGSSGSHTKEELKADADKLKSTAKDRASEKTAEYKDQATSAARSTADAIDKAASHLEDDDSTPSWLASAFRQASKGVEQFASQLEGRSPEQMGREVTTFARQHPGTFLAASAAAGFAAARFLRAGADHKAHSTDGVSMAGQDRYSGVSTRYSTAPATGTTTGSATTGSTYGSTTGSSSGAATSRFSDETDAARQRYQADREGFSQ